MQNGQYFTKRNQPSIKYLKRISRIICILFLTRTIFYKKIIKLFKYQKHLISH